MSSEYHVEGVPPYILGKITQLQRASHEAAHAGSHMPEHASRIREYEHWCRYELERTIRTLLDRSERGAVK